MRGMYCVEMVEERLNELLVPLERTDYGYELAVVMSRNRGVKRMRKGNWVGMGTRDMGRYR